MNVATQYRLAGSDGNRLSNDVNRNKHVDATDLILARNNATGPLSAFRSIVVN